jgi:hypothetical protein
MSDWHTCDTTHCRAGWVEFLAGEAGRKLFLRTNHIFTALQIYKASSPIQVRLVRFFDNDEKALADMKRCADEELALSIHNKAGFGGVK